MKDLGFGIIGPGNIARKFAEAVKQTDGAFLAAVASKSIDKAAEFAGKYNIPAFYDSYDMMCNNQNVDVVYISTTNNFHYDNILTCIANKKHVICEKPMVMTKSQAEDIFSKAKDNNIFVMEAMWSRCLPSTIKAKDLITSGAIGEIKHLTSSFNYLLPYNPEWRLFNKSLGGGVLYDLGIYCLSLSMLFAGEKPMCATGYADLCSQDTDIHDSVIMKFPSGATAGFICSTDVSSLNEMNIYGTNGSLKLNNRFHNCHKVELFQREEVVETFDFDFINGFVYEVAEVIKCVNSGKLQSDIVTWQDTLDCIDVIEKLLSDWSVKKL